MPVNSFENYPMSWKPVKRNDNKPLYISLADQLEELILNGSLAPNTLLPPQRELADYLDINVSTITRALRLCHLKGLIYAAVGKGTFVSPLAINNINNAVKFNNKDVINLSKIEPYNSTNKYINDAAENILRRPNFDSLLIYNSKKNQLFHKSAAVKLLSFLKIPCDIDNIMLTAGSQNALLITLLSLFDGRSKIAVEDFTYHHLKKLASYLSIQLIPILSDEKGMIPSELETVCRTQNVDGVYLMPSCSNPTSVLMPYDRRMELSKILSSNNIIVIEDDAYRFLSNTDMPSFSQLLPHQTVYLFSLSKSLCAGTRVAYMTYPDKFSEKLAAGFSCTNLKLSVIDCELITELIVSKKFIEIFNQKKRLSQIRNNLFNSIFTEENPYSNPLSFYKWIKVNDSADNIVQKALKENIAVMSSVPFSAGLKKPDSYIRVSLSSAQDETKLKKALVKLKSLI